MVRVSRDGFPAHAEPSLAVNPRQSRNVLAAAQVYGTNQHTVGTFVSFDGGRTWHDNGPTLPCLRGPIGPTTSRWRSIGAAQGSWLPWPRGQTAQGLSQSNRGVYVWRTDDGGRTFQRPVAVAQGHFADHPWLATGTSPDSAGDVYVAWSAVLGSGYDRSTDVLAFSRSVDGGRHFSSPRAIASPAGGVLAPMTPPARARSSRSSIPRGSAPSHTPDADSGDAAGTPPPASGHVLGGTHHGRPLYRRRAAFRAAGRARARP